MVVRCNHARNSFLVWSAIALAIALAFWRAPAANAQTLTTGAISGTVTDQSGAVVPNATVTATSNGTGYSRTVQSESNGNFNFAQMPLGEYRLNVKAAGFRNADVGPIAVQVAQTATQNVSLEIGQATQTVEVTAQGSIIQVDNPNTTTTVSSQAIANLPNPGGDLTFEAQFAPGGVMNNTGGYGNVEFNGLPATSNNFTIDGLDANDPFLNLNNSGATNLQLGLDAIQEVSVNTTSYATDQGRLGASQINYTTKSGTNQIHGQLHEIWNGSLFNTADYFVNATGGTKPRSNVNEFGGNVGGPIIKDKWFYFADVEGTRIAIPIVESNITTPSLNYQNYVLNTALPSGGFDPVFSRNLPAQPAEVPFYKTMFGLYGNPGGTPLPEIGCPLNTDGSTISSGTSAPDGAGCANQRTFNLINFAKETLVTGKVDRSGEKNQLWWRFQLDNGQQPTYKDPINSIFDAISIQPERNGNMGWTHTFGPTLVNNFNPGFAWYSAIFEPLSLTKTLDAFPIDLFSNFQGLGGIDEVWPQGRNVTQWQLNDTMTWTKGKHEIKFGANTRRVLVSDHDTGILATPVVEDFDLPAFTFGAADLSVQNFPISEDEPIGIVNLDTFFDDTFKATQKLTLTFGVRATWNSNPKNQQDLYSELPGSFFSISHSVDQPLNQVISPDQAFLFRTGTPLIFWQPRGAFAYQLKSNTVIRGGFGVFSDIFPASLADSMAENPPYDPQFVGGPFGSPGIGGNAVAPGVPGSIESADAAANAAFQAGFTSGALSCAAPTALPPPNCVPSAGVTAVPSGQMQYPYSMQWSLGVQQQFANSWGLQVQYVGTRAVHQPYNEQVNGFETACAGCFSPWPFNNPVDERMGGVTQYLPGAMSTYNGLQTSMTKRLSHGLTFTGNYTWSHCLDTISNAGNGFSPTSNTNPIPGELYRYYGNCDYDVRNSFNGNYVYQLPFHSASAWLNQAIGGWQISGDLFMRTGFPFSVQSASCGTYIIQGSGLCFANQLSGVNPYSKLMTIQGVTQPGQVQWLNPAAFESVIDPSTDTCVGAGGVEANTAANCQYGSMGRNSLFGPGFFWSDFFLTKRFKLTERLTLRVDGQFYNVFNHPSFNMSGVPTAGIPGIASTLVGVGTINSEVKPPTGLLGSGLGGDNAVRMIALQGRLEF